jgi:low temperature requirement protein LtrA
MDRTDRDRGPADHPGMVTPRRARIESRENHSVSTLELFFDLVFVFALTRVTDLMAEDTTGTTFLRGVLILCVMWWCWVGYLWLGNVTRPDEGVIRLGVYSAMAAVFLAAITIPESFDDFPGGLSGPVVFAFCYFVVRVVHLALYFAFSRDDAVLRRQLLRWIPSIVLGTALLLAASQTSGIVQTSLWVAAVVADYVGTALSGSGWRLASAAHFAERHGLIIIVALGESIVSIGIGVAALPISWPIIVATVLGLVIVWALWWAYFDVTALIAERALAAAEGARRVQLGRGGYTFLHLPMIVGIIMMALGLKKALEYTGDAEHHTLADPLYGVPLAALYGGAALYLWFRRYLAGQLNVERLVLGALLVAVAPLAALLPAMASLALLAVLLVVLLAWETHRFADERHRIRHAGGH